MEPPNESNPPRPPPPPSPSLFSSLPDDIVLCILARVSALYYPTLSLVSKSFRSLIISDELDRVRYHLKTGKEYYVYVCLQSSTHPCDRRWFSLWQKPYDHQTLTHCRSKDKCTGNCMLLPTPSSFSRSTPILHENVGSETYEIGGQNTVPSSTDVWVYNKLTGKRHKAPSMMVARKNALTSSLDGKLYVMGGCEADESTHWAEVFDPKTQTWEPLPDPGVELRYSSLEKLQVYLGKVYVTSNKKKFVYLTKKSRWEVVETDLIESMCEIENVWYCYDKRCLWYDTNFRKWRLIQGLSGLDEHYKMDTVIGNYGGKLVVFWGRVLYPVTKKIWCAVILLEKSRYGEVWGHIEWLGVVLVVPRSYRLMHCVNSLQ